MERRKFYTVVCIAISAVLLVSNFCLAKYSGGDGTSANPYKIANPNDLLVLAADTNDYSKAFILINDINLAEYTFTKAVIASDTNSSTYDFEGTAFTGVFDGNGHSITSLEINTGGVSNYYLGLFGQIGSGGIVKNLGIEDANIIGGASSYFVGGLCGYNRGSITNCYSTSSVSGTGSVVGGLCGYNRGSITNCYSTGDVSGEYEVGGLCGWNYEGSISDCYSTGTVTGTGTGVCVGGLWGWNYEGSISNCYSTGTVTGSGDFVGGLCGRNGYDDVSGGTIITNCYSTGNVSGRWYVGGLCGRNYGNIINCYSTGNVSGTNGVGGLCGYNSSGNITNCYSTGNASGTGSYVGGLCGDNLGIITNCCSTGNIIGSEIIGGLCGSNFGSITNCYSTGTVSGTENVGGLCGVNGYGSIIANCYSTGTVSGTGYCVGGLCGYNSGGISNCYSIGSVSGKSDVGGLCGYEIYGSISSCYFLNTAGVDNGYGEPLTDEQMKQQASFAGWNFPFTGNDSDNWFMAFDGYPILTWQISDADIYMDGKNNLKDWAVFAGYWMREDCRIYNDFCEFADMDFDHDVDVDDLMEFMSYWLEEGIY